jgi:hypothetical protein
MVIYHCSLAVLNNFFNSLHNSLFEEDFDRAACHCFTTVLIVRSTALSIVLPYSLSICFFNFSTCTSVSALKKDFSKSDFAPEIGSSL